MPETVETITRWESSMDNRLTKQRNLGKRSWLRTEDAALKAHEAERRKQQRQNYREANREKLNRSAAVANLRRYGLAPADYDRLFDEQGGVCAICRQPPGARSLSVDHCHGTDTVRGLLCSRCNPMLGYANDDPATLLAAINYLKANSET